MSVTHFTRLNHSRSYQEGISECVSTDCAEIVKRAKLTRLDDSTGVWAYRFASALSLCTNEFPLDRSN